MSKRKVLRKIVVAAVVLSMITGAGGRIPMVYASQDVSGNGTGQDVGGAAKGDVAEDDIPEEKLPGSSIPENDAIKDNVAERDVSGNDISGNDMSEIDMPEDGAANGHIGENAGQDPAVHEGTDNVATGAFEEDFETDSWKETAYAYRNVYTCKLDGNYSNIVATAVDKGIPGEIIWALRPEKLRTMEELQVSYAARSIMGTKLYFQISYDGEEWTTVHDNGESGEWQETKSFSVALEDGDMVMLKLVLDSKGNDFDTWASVDCVSANILGELKGNVITDFFAEDFQEEGWKETAYGYSNVYTCKLDSNYSNIVATAQDKSVPGEIVWALRAEEDNPIGSLKVSFAGRSIMGTRLYFQISCDGGITWADVYENDDSGVWQNTQDFDIKIEDAEMVMLKLVLDSTGGDFDTWASIDQVSARVSVREEGNDNPIDQTDSKVIEWKMSEKLPELTVNGQVHTDSIVSRAGNVEESREVLVLEPGSDIAFRIPEELGNQTTLALELQEVHKRTDNPISYEIELNGDRIYERKTSPSSDGANHYYVRMSKGDLLDENTVRIVNTGEEAVRFGCFWMYENLEALLNEENAYRKMDVILFQPGLTYTDAEKDLATLREIEEAYAGYGMYRAGVAFDIYYMHLEKKELYARVDWIMELVSQTGLSLYLDLNSWWSGTPGGMDGQGGFWKDITNQQIIYDPDNVNGRGQWQLTTPNIWGNTPWLSLNNQWYNTVRNQKLEELSSYIAAKKAELSLQGRPVDVHIFMENEPIYWAYSHYNSDTVSGRADLSYRVLEEARRQGFDLDPTDGMSEEEQKWMLDNLTDYIQKEGDAVQDGIASEAVLVDHGTVIMPDSFLSEDSFSHIMMTYDNLREFRTETTYALWETHVVDSLRLGLELCTNGEMESTDMAYIVARGKYADINAERSAMGNFNFLTSLYRWGSDCGIIFNYYDGDQALVAAADRNLEEETELKQTRTENLWITYRADAARLLGELEGNAGAVYRQAAEAYRNGRYVTAYELALQAGATQQLPARFSVAGDGKLGDYPVAVTVDSDEIVHVTLMEAGEDSIRLKLQADRDIPVMVSWEGVSSYGVEDLGNGEYRLIKGAQSTAELIARGFTDKDYPSFFEAMYQGQDGGKLRIQSQDGEIGEYVTYVALTLADGCVITREKDGEPESAEQVNLSDLKTGDALEITTNDKDEVTSVRAVYGEVTGRVVSVEYPVVDGTLGLSNPYITVQKPDKTQLRLEICNLTGFDYPTMTGTNMNTSNLTDYGLKPGDKISVAYSPYVWKDSAIKALRLYKTTYNKNVLDENFEKEDWAENALSYDNVYTCNLDGNHPDIVATAQDKSRIGEIIWEISQDDSLPISEISLEYAGRSIMGSHLRLYMSVDGGATWEAIADNGDNGSFATGNHVLLTEIEAGSVQIKAVMDSTECDDPDTWSSLNYIRAEIPTADLLKARAVDAAIMEIGEVSLESGDILEAVKAAYEALTEEQKAMVENDDFLRDALEKYRVLLEESGKDNPGDDPEKPGTDPEKPGDDPEKPGTEPEKPGDDPEKPGTEPEKPGTEPDKPGENPEKPGDDPDNPGNDPEKPGTAPDNTGNGAETGNHGEAGDSESGAGSVPVSSPPTGDSNGFVLMLSFAILGIGILAGGWKLRKKIFEE